MVTAKTLLRHGNKTRTGINNITSPLKGYKIHSRLFVYCKHFLPHVMKAINYELIVAIASCFFSGRCIAAQRRVVCRMYDYEPRRLMIPLVPQSPSPLVPKGSGYHPMKMQHLLVNVYFSNPIKSMTQKKLHAGY